MKPADRTRLASMGVLFLVLVTGFLLGLAWDRTDGLLRADESSEEAGSATTTAATPERVGETSGERGRDSERSAKTDGSGETATPSEEADDRGRDDGERRLIVHRVGITVEQEARVDSIVDVHGDRIRELRRRMKDEYDPRFRAIRRERDSLYGPRFDALLLETRRSIRSVLSEEQAVRYDSLLAEHDRKEAEREKREAEEKSQR